MSADNFSRAVQRQRCKEADLAAEVDRLRAERDALRSVDRHYHQGDVLYGSGWSSDGPEWQTPPSTLAPAAVPVTEAEAAAIRNAIWGTVQ